MSDDKKEFDAAYGSDDKKEFDTAYKTLYEEMYGVQGYKMDEKIQISKSTELIRPDLLQLKTYIDNNLLGLKRMIYKRLRL